MDRGWYAGPVGWMDATEDGEFCVALRSALLRDREAHLYAGVGVVAGSDPAAELAETEVKLEALLPLLAELRDRSSDSAASPPPATRLASRPPVERRRWRWRSTVTSIRPVPAASASGSSSSDSRRRWGRPKRAAALATSTPRGVPSSASNSSPLERLGLGQEVEDAAAVVVDDDDPDRGGDVAQGGEAADVVEEAEVAGDDRGRAAAGVGGADPGGDQAVDPVGAAVAEEERRRPRPAGRKASWSRIGMLEAV